MHQFISRSMSEEATMVYYGDTNTCMPGLLPQNIGTASAHYTEIEAHFYYLGEQVRLCTETQDQNGQNIPRADNICQRIFRRFILAFKY